MNYTYTIRRVEPKQRHLGVVYHVEGRDDYFKNFTTDDFTAAGITALVERFAPEVRAYWEAYDAASEAAEVSVGEGAAGNAERVIYEEPPEYDPMYQALEEAETFDEATLTRTKSWTVVAKPLAEALKSKLAEIASKRYAKEGAGIVWTDTAAGKAIYLDTTFDSQSRFTAARTAVEGGTRTEGGVWKCADVTSGEPVLIFRHTTNAEVIEWSGLVHDHVQKCFEAEGIATSKVMAAYASNDEATMLAVSYDAEFDRI